MAPTVRVLVVDDSATSRQLLQQVIDAEPMCQVVGVASDGDEAIRLAKELHPKIVTMDLHMPGMDGYEAIPKIVGQGCRVVVISGAQNEQEIRTALDMMRLGAVEIVPKPDLGEGLKAFVERVGDTVVRLALASSASWPSLKSLDGVDPHLELSAAPRGPEPIVLFGGSTGAPSPMIETLKGMPSPFPAPIVVAQHIASGFVGGLADWLGRESGHRVELARAGESPQAGLVQVVPVPNSLKFAEGLRFAPLPLGELPVGFGTIAPSIDALFETAAVFGGNRIVAVLFSGMGRDGVRGMQRVLELGGYGAVQEPESCVVPGMPGAALDAGLPVETLALADLSRRITERVLDVVRSGRTSQTGGAKTKP